MSLSLALDLPFNGFSTADFLSPLKLGSFIGLKTNCQSSYQSDKCHSKASCSNYLFDKFQLFSNSNKENRQNNFETPRQNKYNSITNLISKSRSTIRNSLGALALTAGCAFSGNLGYQTGYQAGYYTASQLDSACFCSYHSSSSPISSSYFG
jgi:hypothetical protein